MKVVDQHAWDLQEAIGALHDPEAWMQSCEWLRIVAGLRDVACDSRHDRLFGYCETADAWNDQTDRVRSRYLLHGTRLLFACGALEAAARSEVGPKSIKKKGIVKAIGSALDGGGVAIPPGYLEVAWHIAVSGSHDARFRERTKQAGHISLRAAGAFLAYEVRNRLAHGTLYLVDAWDDDDGRVDHEVHFVDLATRAILLTLQMLAVARLKDPHARVDEDDVGWTAAETAVSRADFLREIHTDPRTQSQTGGRSR